MKNTLTVLLVLAFTACQSSGRGSKRGNELAPPSTPIMEGPQTPVDPQPPVDAPINPIPPVTKTDEPRVPVILSEGDPASNDNVPYGLIELSSSAESLIIARPQYVLSWNPATRNINWASWVMDKSQLGTIGRQGNFSIDPILDPYLQSHNMKSVVTTDYTGSGWDRGHQIASSDRQANDADNKATFYTTNIIPQTSFLNQVIWKNLEESIKTWISKGEYQKLWIVSGPIYKGELSYMGPQNDIAVPKANFKAVFSWNEFAEDKPFLVKAVIMPNVLSKGEDPVTHVELRRKEASSGGKTKGETTISQEIDSYEASLSAIEAAAHIKFPPAVSP